MVPRPIRHRRGRRTDLMAVLAVLAASGLPVPPPDRATLRRFRHLVADLGTDLYIALIDEVVVGFVHVTYARQLTSGPRARVEALVVTPAARRRGVAASLAGLVRQRAERRGCSFLHCQIPAGDAAAHAFLAGTGWRGTGEEFQFDLAGPAQ